MKILSVVPFSNYLVNPNLICYFVTLEIYLPEVTYETLRFYIKPGLPNIKDYKAVSNYFYSKENGLDSFDEPLYL